MPIAHSNCYRPCVVRLPPAVVPGLPHQSTLRGNRREAIFFHDGDHEVYLDLLAGNFPASEHNGEIHPNPASAPYSLGLRFQ